MAEILCVYRQVAMMRCQAERGESQGQDSDGGSLAIVSYDEKPGMQAIATTAPDRPPLPGVSPRLSGTFFLYIAHGIDSTGFGIVGERSGHERGSMPCAITIAFFISC